MAAVMRFLRNVSSPISQYRVISTCPHMAAGEKWRVSKGLAPDGLRYGPLTDRPDWSYADGRPAPETKKRKLRRRIRLTIAKRVKDLLQEIDTAKGNTDKMVEKNVHENTKDKKSMQQS